MEQDILENIDIDMGIGEDAPEDVKSALEEEI